MASRSNSPRYARQMPARPTDKVWKEFLDTVYVKPIFDGDSRRLDVKVALSACLEPLERIADSEDRGHDRIILVNYLVHTFYGLREAQEKEPDVRFIMEYDEWIYFNTGLLTDNMESIFAAYQVDRGKGAKERDGKIQYFMDNNVNHFMRDVHTIPHCNPLSERCQYFVDYSNLIMDGSKVPTVSWTHIIDENWDRICDVLYPTKDSRRGLTISRVEHRPPVPGKFAYTARAILTLAMAYQNARLVARPEKDWLLAPATVPEMDEHPLDWTLS